MAVRRVCQSFFKPRLTNITQTRCLNCSGENPEMAGVVLGIYTKDDDTYGSWKQWTKTAEEFDKNLDMKLSEALVQSGPIPKLGETRLFYGLEPKYTAIAVTGLGDEALGYHEQEQIDEAKEAKRIAAALGAQALQAQHMKDIRLDSFGHAESAAEGAAMGVWMYQELKERKKHIPRIDLFNDCDFTGWQIGLQKAAAQNLARQMSETPANLLTPIGFAQAAVDVLAKAGVSVEVKVKDWANIFNLTAFTSSVSGSCEPPVFVEIHYYGCEYDVSPAVFIGKGVTFDSGGLCLKPCSDQKIMRGDMSGAAAIVGAARAVSALQLPINFRGLIPLYENMPGSCAMKPGDILRGRSGKSIVVTNTDFDGRLSIADAITYSATYNPKFVLTVGSFSKDTIDTFDEALIPTYANNDSLFESLKIASMHTGDRVWRMPLWRHFSEMVTTTPLGDTILHNDNYYIPSRLTDIAMSAQAAAFLREFVSTDWLHLETYNVLETDGINQRYLRRGLSGRPTRTLIEFLAQLSCISEEVPEEVSSKDNIKCGIA